MSRTEKRLKKIREMEDKGYPTNQCPEIESCEYCTPHKIRGCKCWNVFREQCMSHLYKGFKCGEKALSE